MVMRYSHLAPEDQVSAVDRLVSGKNRRDTNTAPRVLRENDQRDRK
jgi:hypothetical protein